MKLFLTQSINDFVDNFEFCLGPSANALMANLVPKNEFVKVVFSKCFYCHGLNSFSQYPLIGPLWVVVVESMCSISTSREKQKLILNKDL